MIVYFDTSAIVPLLLPEPATDLCRRIVLDSEHAVSCRIAYVEVAAALGQALRTGRATRQRFDRAIRSLDALWERFAVVELDGRLTRKAARQAVEYELRGYDAVHCAAATIIAAEDTVAVSGDRALLAAWSRLNMATVDVNQE